MIVSPFAKINAPVKAVVSALIFSITEIAAPVFPTPIFHVNNIPLYGVYDDKNLDIIF